MSKEHMLQIQLEPSEPVPVTSLDVSHLVEHAGKLFFSTNPNEPLCDAATVVTSKEEKTLFLFQMTIGGSHEISQNTLNKYMAGAKSNKLMTLVLILVVPFKSNFALSQAEFTSNKDIHVKVAILELRPSEAPLLY